MAGSDEKSSGVTGVFKDLRHQFLRGLIQHENWQRTRHYLKSAAECTSRAIVSLELSAQPIKSPRQAQRLENIGGETIKRLKKFMEEDRFSLNPPLSGRFVSSAGALLVALKTEEDLHKDSRGKEDHHFVSEDCLKARATKLCEEEFNDNGFCQAWWRIEVLIKRLHQAQILQEGTCLSSPTGRTRGKSVDKATNPNNLVGHTHNIPVTPDKHEDSRQNIPVQWDTSRLAPVKLDRSGGNSRYMVPTRGDSTDRLAPVKLDKSGGNSRYTVPTRSDSTECLPEMFHESFTGSSTEILTTPKISKSKISSADVDITTTDHANDRMESWVNLIDKQSVISHSLSRTDHDCNRSGSSLLPWQCDQTGLDYRQGNDTGSDGLILLVDTSEWGGEQGNLMQLGEMLNNVGMTYQTKKLTTGDYSWRWRYHGDERVLPCLVERKRADDLARTLKDGRFWSQVQKMANWKEKFMTFDLPCELFYVIEGKPEQYVVNCKDGCQGVGMCKNPSLIQVKNAIKDLKSHPDLQVLHADSAEETLAILESITVDLEHKVKAGKFDMMLEWKWERGRENRSPCVITVDDSDEEDLPSIVKSSRLSSTDKTEPIHLDKNVEEETHKKSPGSVICGFHSRASQFDNVLRASPPQDSEHGFNTDTHHKKNDFDITADKCVDDCDGDMEDPDWLPDLTCNTERRQQNRESTQTFSDDWRGKDKHLNVPKLYPKNQKRKIVGVQIETDLLSRNTQLSKRERKTKFEEQDRHLSVHNDLYGGIDVACSDLNGRSISSKVKQRVADDSTDVTGMENWTGGNEQEPLVMYHNSLGFQPQSPVKEKKNSSGIHKVSSHIDTEQYRERNCNSTTRESWMLVTDEKKVKCEGSAGHHDDGAIQIRDMFPSLSREIVHDILSRHSGDIASCVEELLQTQEID